MPHKVYPAWFLIQMPYTCYKEITIKQICLGGSLVVSLTKMFALNVNRTQWNPQPQWMSCTTKTVEWFLNSEYFVCRAEHHLVHFSESHSQMRRLVFVQGDLSLSHFYPHERQTKHLLQSRAYFRVSKTRYDQCHGAVNALVKNLFMQRSFSLFVRTFKVYTPT